MAAVAAGSSMAKAVIAFNGNEDKEELSFAVKDSICILPTPPKCPEGMGYGICKGKSGYFPLNHIVIKKKKNHKKGQRASPKKDKSQRDIAAGDEISKKKKKRGSVLHAASDQSNLIDTSSSSSPHSSNNTPRNNAAKSPRSHGSRVKKSAGEGDRKSPKLHQSSQHNDKPTNTDNIVVTPAIDGETNNKNAQANVGNPPKQEKPGSGVHASVPKLALAPTYNGPYADGGRPQIKDTDSGHQLTPRKVVLVPPSPHSDSDYENDIPRRHPGVAGGVPTFGALNNSDDTDSLKESNGGVGSRNGSTIGSGSGIGKNGSHSLGTVAYRRKVTIPEEGAEKEGGFNSTKRMQAKITYAKALYDYTGNAEKNVLSFNQGAVLEVLIKNEGGWWTGVCEGQAGYFPSNFVMEIDEEEAKRLAATQIEEATEDVTTTDLFSPRTEGDIDAEEYDDFEDLNFSRIGGDKKSGKKKSMFSSKSQPTTPRSARSEGKSGTVIGGGNATERKGVNTITVSAPSNKGGSAINSRTSATTPRNDATQASSSTGVERRKKHAQGLEDSGEFKKGSGFFSSLKRLNKKSKKKSSKAAVDV